MSLRNPLTSPIQNFIHQEIDFNVIAEGLRLEPIAVEVYFAFLNQLITRELVYPVMICESENESNHTVEQIRNNHSVNHFFDQISENCNLENIPITQAQTQYAQEVINQTILIIGRGGDDAEERATTYFMHEHEKLKCASPNVLFYDFLKKNNLKSITLKKNVNHLADIFFLVIKNEFAEEVINSLQVYYLKNIYNNLFLPLFESLNDNEPAVLNVLKLLTDNLHEDEQPHILDHHTCSHSPLYKALLTQTIVDHSPHRLDDIVKAYLNSSIHTRENQTQMAVANYIKKLSNDDCTFRKNLQQQLKKSIKKKNEDKS